jgi:hypothetical protein
MACLRHDGGVVWLHHALQVGSFFPVVLVWSTPTWQLLASWNRNIWALYLTVSEIPHSGFWPTAAVYLQKSPSFGWIFHHPLVTSVWSSYELINSSAILCSPVLLFSALIPACWNFAADHSVQRKTGPGVIRRAAGLGSPPGHAKSPVLYRSRPIDICTLFVSIRRFYYPV